MRDKRLLKRFTMLFAAVIVALLPIDAVCNYLVQKSQAEQEMLEKAQVLAQQTDAVWEFMELNQHQFKTNEDGTYRMYCVVAAKSISSFFTEKGDYVIHYTNTSTRKPRDSPDEFEQEALAAFHEDDALPSYQALTETEDGGAAYRYVKPVRITDSCLECHGEPAGEIDQMGYPKEGLKSGDIAGAVSILIPADLYLENLRENAVYVTLFAALVVLTCLAIVAYGLSHFVTKPLSKLEDAAQQIESRDFSIDVSSVGNNDELESLALHIDSMASQLRTLYEGLEDEVAERTAQLAGAKELLEQQRNELEIANEQLRKDGEYKSNFLAIMSHELRTPLTSILAFADIWEKITDRRSEEELTILREIKANSRILLEMVNNILEMARLNAGKTVMHVESVDLVDLAQVVKGTTQSLAEKKHIHFQVVADKNVPIISADNGKLRRVLENLVSNAIKFTAEGGCVSLRIAYCETTSDVIVSVEDSGYGIKQDDIPHIFDRFVQSVGSGPHIGGGSGLGLAVVRELTELHHGSIEVESTVGKGSTFRLRLPIVAHRKREL